MKKKILQQKSNYANEYFEWVMKKIESLYSASGARAQTACVTLLLIINFEYVIVFICMCDNTIRWNSECLSTHLI